MNSDSQLQSDVLAELQWKPTVNAAHIGVSAKNNTITLTGQVDHYAEKMAAQEAAMCVYGVRAVANDITVQLPTTCHHTDQDIAAAALSSMAWHFEVPADRIQVTVSEGRVTLEGNVDWEFQKDAAQSCIRNLMGVQSIHNRINITPTVKWSDVKNEIEAAFRRSADIDARRIGVETREGKVILTGSVSSWSERTEAISAAWAAPGVTAVDDKLVVAL